MAEKQTSMITNISDIIIPTDDDFLPSKFSPRIKQLFIFLYILVIFGSVSGNSVIIVVTLCNKAMHRVVNLFFVSLAISDTLVAVCNMPLQLEYYVSNEWNLGEAMCKITSYIQGVCIVTSIFTLTVLATER
ncbi:hypothetical protein CHS0354_028374 [Potamilus streckersoni]|uniref:G-protein coupled receptors family 1 profile domain-containing protein n=1 Tax=Potamilus streckersoni TaxID=2493646 RepID=A0AAE0VJ55_9BIVA|nr:hypothetical protein CHS0354_028374 [Potamilus streckersoni]